MEWILLVTSAVELLLLGTVLFIFLRMRRSEGILCQLKATQSELLEKLETSSKLEKELVDNFALRQKELVSLDRQLQDKIGELRKLLTVADKLTKSPEFIRQVVLAGHKRGESIEALARQTGLSGEEILLIVDSSL